MQTLIERDNDLVVLTENEVTFYYGGRKYTVPVTGNIEHLYKTLDSSSSVFECVMYGVLIYSEEELAGVLILSRTPYHKKVFSVIEDKIFYWEYIIIINQLRLHPSFFNLNGTTYYV